MLSPTCSLLTIFVVPQRQTHRQCLKTLVACYGKVNWTIWFEANLFFHERSSCCLPFSINILYLRMNKDKNPKWPQVRHCCNWHNKKKSFSIGVMLLLLFSVAYRIPNYTQLDWECKQIGCTFNVECKHSYNFFLFPVCVVQLLLNVHT